jgi:hypothetical protein
MINTPRRPLAAEIAMTSLPPRQKGLSLTNGTSLTKSYNGTLSVKWGQTFRIRHDQYSQTPPSGRNRYEVTSAQAKRPITH